MNEEDLLRMMTEGKPDSDDWFKDKLEGLD